MANGKAMAGKPYAVNPHLRLERRGYLLMVFALILPLAMFAETVARAIVTLEQGSVWLYAIDEDGNWAQSQKLVDTYDTVCRNPMHAVYRNRIAYVSDKPGYVHKYNLSGTRLGAIELPDFDAEGLAITPNGDFLFVSAGSTIKKVDLADDTVSEFCNLGGSSLFRDMEIDGNGHLYVADRGTNKLHIFDYASEVNANVPTSVDFNFCEGVGWNPVENLVYVAGNDKQWGVFYPDGTVHTPLTTASTANGWCTGVACVNGQMYFESYSGKKLYRLDVQGNDFIEVAGVDHSPSAFKGSDVCAVVDDNFEKTEWCLDDANGAACSQSDSDAPPLLFKGGVRMASEGVVSNCAVFASNSSRMSIRGSSGFIPATGDFAVFFWVGLSSKSQIGDPRNLLSNAVGSDGDFALTADANGVVNALGLSFWPTGALAAVEINTTAIVADGSWHHVGVVRHGTSLELWMDGERLGLATVAAGDAIAAGRDWCFGSTGDGLAGFAGIGTFYDEVMFTDDPPTVKSDIAQVFSGDVRPQTAPVLPPAPVADPMPASLGVEIDHVFANEAAFSMPSLLIAANGDFYVACGRGNGICDADYTTSVYRSGDDGVSWTTFASLQASSVSLFEQDGTLCAVGMKAGLGYPASARTFAVWTADAGGNFIESTNVVASMDCKLMPSPVVVATGIGGKLQIVLAVVGDNAGTATPAQVRFDVDGHEFRDGWFSARTDRGFVSSGKYTTFADVLGGNVMPSGVNFVTMYPVIDRASPYPEIMVGPERVAYQNVLGNGNWSRFRYNQFRGGAKPFNVRRDEESSMYYAVTVPSTNRSELVSANAEDVVGTLALYASPNPEMMAWYPCGVIDASAVYGFAAPAFAFDGDDLVIACAVSAPDGCGVRARTAANYLSFRRVADFRARYAPQLPALGNRTRAYMATERFIMKYYRTPDGEWQSDGVLVNDLKEMYNITSAADIQIRGNRLFLLSESSRTFYALDVAGRLLSTYTGPAGIQATGMDVSADCSRALVACGANGVYEVDLSDNSWRQILAVGGNLGNPRDVAILPDGGFLVTDYQWGSHYTLRYDASATSSTVLNVDTTGYFTGATVSPSGEWGFFGRVYGGVYRVNLADNTCTTMRDNISGNPFLASYFMSCGDGKLLVSSKSGANWAYDFATGAASAPFVEHDGLSGIAIYEYVAPGFMLLFK